MKKNTKATLPSIYEGLNENQAILTKQCITIDKNGLIFRFNTPQECHIIKDAIAYQFKDFNTFDDAIKPNEMIEWHEKYFDKALPPATEKNTAQIAAWVWLKLCRLATDRTTTPKDPTTGTKSKISGRIYFRVLDEMGNPVPSTIKTPQAITCLAIFDATTKENTRDNKKSLECSEADLKAAIYARGPELKTRQNAWRIFQYYRPQLIAAKVIRYQ